MNRLQATQETSAQPLAGFDPSGELLVDGGRLFRRIFPGEGARVRRVLDILRKEDLFRAGIVPTKETRTPARLHQECDLLLEHEHLPFISYSHEWTSDMLKDAALFHIDLFLKLGVHGLTLKDWHPLNILFRGVEPVFVDFTSIIPAEDLTSEAYLTPPAVPSEYQGRWDSHAAYLHEMYRRMFLPYFLYPLHMMRQGRHPEARTRMRQTTLNTRSDQIQAEEVVRPGSAEEAMLKAHPEALTEPGPLKRGFFLRLRQDLEPLQVSPRASKYSSYYEAKGEQLGYEPCAEWKPKHVAVHGAIQEFRPRTLLDVGCNTGWFSILAARQGCGVVAVDVDEASTAVLYRIARREKLSILPLVLDLSDLTQDTYPARELLEEVPRARRLPPGPVLLAAETRLRCDMVLGLALVHHLVLGQGWTLEKVAQVLSSLTGQVLVVEFVRRDDPLILAEPEFFPAYAKAPEDFGAYTQERCVAALARHFSSVRLCAGSEEARPILVCVR